MNSRGFPSASPNILPFCILTEAKLLDVSTSPSTSQFVIQDEDENKSKEECV